MVNNSININKATGGHNWEIKVNQTEVVFFVIESGR